MKHLKLSTSQNFWIIIASLILMIVQSHVKAQSLNDYIVTSGNEPFVQITGTTLPLSSGSLDDGVFTNIPIGFAFDYLGTNFSTVSASTNGWLSFVSPTTNSSLGNNLATGTGVRPLLAPLWDDNQLPSASDFSYITTVLGGDSVFIAQWLNVWWRYTAATPVLSFQVILNKTDRSIKFTYREEAGAPNTPTASIGICGTATGPGNFLSLSSTGTNPTVSSTTETSNLSVNPVTGQFYKFTPPPLVANNLGVIAITSPLEQCGLGSSSPVTLVVRNFGTASQASIPLNYSINGGIPVSQTFTSTLNPGDTASFTLTTPASFPATTTTAYSVTGWVALPGDQFTLNDTLIRSFTKYVAPLPLISFTGFTGANLNTVTTGWNEANGFIPTIGTGNWLSNTTAFPGNTTATIGLTTTLAGAHWILSPTFTTVGGDVVDFLAAQATTAGASVIPLGFDDSISIRFTTDCGQSWNTLFSFTTANSPTSSLSNYLVGLGLPAGVQVQVAIVAYTGSIGSVGTGNFFVDDIRVRQLSGTDMRVSSLLSPRRDCEALAASPVTITLNNAGANPQTGFSVSYTVNGGSPVTEFFTGTIASGASQNYTFTQTANLLGLASVSITASVSATGDSDPSNDTLTRGFVQFLPPYAVIPFTGFTGANLPAIAPGWVEAAGFVPVEGTSNWTSNTTAFSGNTTATVNLNTTLSGQQWIISHAIDATTNTALELKVAYATTSGGVAPAPIGFDDSVVIAYTTNCGLTWTPILSFTNSSTPTNVLTIQTASLGLSAPAKVRIGILAVTGTTSGGANFFIDDLQIRELVGNNLQLFAITSPTSGCNLTTSTPVAVTIRNVGTSAQTGFPVSYRINGGAIVTETVAGNVAPGSNLSYTFTQNGNFASSGPGTYTLDAWVSFPGDTDPSNDSLLGYTLQNIPNISTFPYFQNFESGAGGWVSSGTNSTWALGTPAKPVINSAASGINSWITGLSTPYVNSENSQVLSPCFNFSTLIAPLIELKVWWNTEFSWDGAVLQSSIDGGSTWQNVGALGQPNWYNDNSINGNPGGQQIGWSGRISTNNGSGGWVLAKNALTGLAGQSSVFLRIAFGTDFSAVDDGFAFDDILIFDRPANDIGVTALVNPSPECGGFGVIAPQVVVKNFGTAPQSNFQVLVNVNGGTPVTQLFTGTLAPDSAVTISFLNTIDLTAATTTTFNISAWTILTNDAIGINDTLPNVPVVNRKLALPIVDFTGFNGTNLSAITSGWREGANFGGTVGNSSWTSSTAFVGNTTANLWMGTSAPGNHWIISPTFEAGSSSVLEMQAAWASFTGGPTTTPMGSDDSVTVLISSNCGQTWNYLFGFNSTSGLNNTFSNHTVSLGQSATAPVRIAIVANLGTQFGGEYFFIDNLNVRNLSNIDMEMVSINRPTSGCNLTTSDTVEVTIRNVGTAPQTSIPVSYRINGGTAVTEIITATINPLGILNYKFSATGNFTSTGPGVYLVDAWVGLSGDSDLGNDTIIGYSVVNIPVINAFPYYQNFEIGSGGWNSGGNLNTWALGTPAKSVINSAFSGNTCWITGLSAPYNDNENSFVVSPCFNFSSLANPYVSLSINWNTEFSWDGAVLQTSIDGGTTWQNQGSLGQLNWYNDNSINGNPGGQQIGWSGRISSNNGSNGWRVAIDSLESVAGQSSVFFRVAFGADGSVVDDGVAFDDFYIQDGAITGIPADLMNNGISVYPNPVEQRLYLKTNMSLETLKQLEVYNAQGKLILSSEGESLTKLITFGLDTRDWATGLYIVHIKSNDSSVKAKVIKQ
jgi:hypothetical protein